MTHTVTRTVPSIAYYGTRHQPEAWCEHPRCDWAYASESDDDVTRAADKHEEEFTYHHRVRIRIDGGYRARCHNTECPFGFTHPDWDIAVNAAQQHAMRMHRGGLR